MPSASDAAVLQKMQATARVGGNQLFEGRGVGRDEARAAALYEKACDGGVAKGCYILGALLMYGRGVAKNEVRAASAYARGCVLRDPGSCAMAPK